MDKEKSINGTEVIEKKEKRKIKDKKLIKMRKLRYIIETVTVLIIAIIMLILITNKTFFREEYQTDKIKIDLPLLTFFVKDKDNVVELLTLRKSEYVKNYFDVYLESLDRYSCDGKIFYYDNKYDTAIYSISVEKNFAIKKIKINYENNDINKLCEGKD